LHAVPRVSVEAGIGLGWRGYVGDAGVSVSLEHLGESADYQKLHMRSIASAGRKA